MTDFEPSFCITVALSISPRGWHCFGVRSTICVTKKCKCYHAWMFVWMTASSCTLVIQFEYLSNHGLFIFIIDHLEQWQKHFLVWRFICGWVCLSSRAGLGCLVWFDFKDPDFCYEWEQRWSHSFQLAWFRLRLSHSNDGIGKIRIYQNGRLFSDYSF